jgi:hypothetical protein
MEAIQKFSAGQLNQATFECQLLGAFFAAVSSYMVMDTMLGIAVVARRLGLPDEEVLEVMVLFQGHHPFHCPADRDHGLISSNPSGFFSSVRQSGQL